MSFFGFDTTLPRDRGHPTNAPGFGQTPDPFAGLSRGAEDDDDGDAIDFEETYDGLGDKLDETDDAFNNDTFGGDGGAAREPVGKDFDFFGQTAKVSRAINEEQVLFTRQQAPSKSVSTIATSPQRAHTKPLKTGYEKYKQPDTIPDLQVNESLWGAPAKKAPVAAKVSEEEGSHQRHLSSSGKKMMSLEEVEAAMRSKKPATSAAPRQPLATVIPPQQQQPPVNAVQQQAPAPPTQQPQPISQQPLPQGPRFPQPPRNEMPAYGAQQPPQALPRQSITPTHPGVGRPPPPRQILQNPIRQQHQSGLRSLPYQQPAPSGMPGGLPSHPGLPAHSQQLLHLSEEERAAFLIEEAKRVKRNHKIHLLSKDNGLMTPQDKNFVTRIQLQQLVTATGNPNEAGTDAALMEDFYYQVHNQIRGGPRQNPFAQTYLYRTDGTSGGRRQHRGGDNHMQRMEQQVQRAVEASKARPKNNQLVLEGSLGKISFSNAKTPKPLLNFKRAEISSDPNRPHHAGRGPQPTFSAGDRKSVLHAIEKVYDTLMQIEDHDRCLPPPLAEGSDAAIAQQHIEWKQKMQALNQKLWDEMKIMDPIIPDAASPHAFIAFLSYAKGKKAIPRIFRHIDQEQRVIILTMIVVFLGSLDVVRFAQLQPGELQLPSTVREGVELFSQAVMPSLFAYVNEAPLKIVVGLLGIIWERVNVQAIAKTKVGLGILTMFFSRGELIRQAGEGEEKEWEQWNAMYNRIFDTLESCLGQIFPPSTNTAEDMYVWQFLAALGVGATPEQQQRLVMAVKDHVMETVMQSKTLPPEISSQKLSNVNLFMRSIGLDVGQLD
ncbi:hypothetical protein GP486_001198 [Trichoglossum hirsutum]|uniref:mRNA decay factor PAT1 domain-containing protein n=1 Tax=Trichoglossum hirsutum TaxID=265104 RepID=A0A9P8LHH4_9PEZI|nr:hypothetical protein GP486_001198 [Trichoglossum hirsutum]